MAFRGLPAVSIAFSILLLLLLIGFVLVFSRFGLDWIARSEASDASTVLRQGILFQAEGRLNEAVESYRTALRLGIESEKARQNCLQRLQWILAERGHKAGTVVDRDNAIVTDPGLETLMDPDTPWYVGGAPAVRAAVVGSEPVDGRTSVRIEFDSSAEELIAQPIAVIPGYAYQLSCWIRAESVTGAGVRAGVGSTHTTELVTGVADWKQYVLPFVAETAPIRFALIADGSHGTVWIDGVYVFPERHSTLSNGSFEAGELGRRYWLGEVSDRASVAVDRDVKLEGRQALRVSLPARENLGLWQEVPVMAGGRYVITGWVRTRDAGGMGACIEVCDADNRAGFLTRSALLTGTRDWTPLTLQFEVPRDTASLLVMLRRPAEGSEPETLGEIWFDALRMESVS